MSSERRPATGVDQVMDRFVADFVALDPIAATGAGITGHQTGLPDLSPDGKAEISALRSRTLTALAAAVPVDSERAWLLLRDEVRAREGSGFELKSFHRRALDLGSVGLDVLRSAVLGEFEGGSR
ncbi:DUF885 family protein [Kribbella sp. NBC_00889]|uniref:DUF885 family protein n=1 Tax=Kribbella sp. NBC_00889 TaxID=2975974 RepID=UPI003863FC05|nr:DUF885 domain-containing protein [Kribbella sp. NBC_00889]